MAEARWRITVDRDVCVTSGNCAAMAAEVFEVTDDGARVLREEIPADEAVAEAAEACPMEAIRIVNVLDGTQIVP